MNTNRYGFKSLAETISRAIIVIIVASTLIVHKDCLAESTGQPYKAPSTEAARWSNPPLSYVYMKGSGTLDEQSRASLASRVRLITIASHGRAGNQSKSGLYAIAALLLVSASVITWRRVRAKT